MMSNLDTQIMCVMPPKFTKAKTESETYSLVEMLRKDYGFVKKHYFIGVVTYHTPPYEQNVLKANGICCNPENWRIGDLLIVEKVYNVITTCTHDFSIKEPEWDEACVNNIRIKYRASESKIDNYNIELEHIFNDDIYPTAAGVPRCADGGSERSTTNGHLTVRNADTALTIVIDLPTVADGRVSA